MMQSYTQICLMLNNAVLYTVIYTELRSNYIIVDENNQELPVGTVVHCLGALFKITDSGISHFVGKIEDNTYFADQQYFH